MNRNQRQLDGDSTPGFPQYIPIAPGPPRLEQYTSAIPVRVLPPPPPLLPIRTAFLNARLTDSEPGAQ